ncbi:MAG: hypothetical protein UZ21_OP11001001154 [Microgenomates bacterium OLB22]|nr:MAG: hypothetical protein UZ21_OP11001001154 [Microgenomates bacterium OLB22]
MLNTLVIAIAAVLYGLIILKGRVSFMGTYIINPLIKIPIVIVFLPIFGFVMIMIGYILVAPIGMALGLDPLVLKFGF